jgi:hypothetical protein
LWAATGTVAPDGDNTTGSWTTTPLFSKVNEDIDSPDGTFITSPNNPSSANEVIFEVTCPADVGTITEANLRARAKKSASGGREVRLNLVYWSATTATNYQSGNLTTTFEEISSGNKTGLSISKATCDGSTINIVPTTTGTGPGRAINLDTFNLDITYDASGARKRAVIALREPQP